MPWISEPKTAQIDEKQEIKNPNIFHKSLGSPTPITIPSFLSLPSFSAQLSGYVIAVKSWSHPCYSPLASPMQISVNFIKCCQSLVR